MRWRKEYCVSAKFRYGGRKGRAMYHSRSKPQSANELITILNSAQDNLGKGGRRVANFFIANLGETALLSSSEVASRCGVNASSVVRFVQTLGFSGYREFQSILQQRLSASIVEARQTGAGGISLPEVSKPLRLHLLVDSGRSFNEAAEAAARNFSSQNPSIEIEAESYVSYAVEPEDFARRIESAAENSEGIILVAREHPAI